MSSMEGSRRENHGKQPAPQWGRYKDMEGKRNILEEAKTTSSLNKLWNMWDAYGHDPGEQLLLKCWVSGASGLELEGRETQQLGSLTRAHLTHKIRARCLKPLEAAHVKHEGDCFQKQCKLPRAVDHAE